MKFLIDRLVCVTSLLVLLCFASGAMAQGLMLEDLFEKRVFAPRGLGALDAYGDGEHYTTLEHGVAIRKWSYRTGKCAGDILMFSDLPDSVPAVVDYSISRDGQFALLETQRVRMYRRSALANYWVCRLSDKRVFPLSRDGKQRLATFSSDSRHVAFVRDNNVFVVDLASRQEVAVTRDGRFNHVINGAADWVYEEEFALSTGMVWSPSGRYLAYLRFDESGVREFSMPIFGEGLYTDTYSYKYPKAGEKNSQVEVYVYDTHSGRSVRVDVGGEVDQYIPRIFWSPGNELAVLRLNRLQNHLEVLLADADSGSSRMVYEERESCYVEEPTDWYLTFLSDGKRFIVPSERDGYRHLYLYDMETSRLEQLTQGEDEIVRVYGYSAREGVLYYKGYDGSPFRTAVYGVSVDGKHERGKLSQEDGTNDAWFDPSFRYYLISGSSVRTPLHISLYSGEGERIRILEDNGHLRGVLQRYTLPEKEFFSFKTPDGVDLNGYMVRPPNFDSTHRYPVMMYQYSGPNSQQVVDRFSIDWDYYLASRGCLVVCVDGRGTGGRGEAFRKCTYGKLGALECEDQMSVAKYLASQPYVDAERIGIWGWSYGGYMSSLCLLRGADLFRMAIAVAPVTNWRYYDTIYTERFMGLPQDNASGYDDNSPMNFADRLAGRFLLIHGTADDNVHFQNAVQLAQRLIRAGRPFEMMVYPDRNHSIYGDGATMHLYAHMAGFIERNLLQ